MRVFIAVAGALLLASCQTKQIDEMTYSETKALAAEIVQRCVAQGVKPDTPEMQLCTKQEVSRENSIRKNAEARQGRTVRVQAYCQNFGGNTVCF